MTEKSEPLSGEKLAEIRNCTSIIGLVGEYVKIGRAGPLWTGPCPFHADAESSLFVHPGRQFFHCFGCGKSGDCFAFVMAIEARSLDEAARFLAERAGLDESGEDADDADD